MLSPADQHIAIIARAVALHTPSLQSQHTFHWLMIAMVASTIANIINLGLYISLRIWLKTQLPINA